MPRTMKVTRDIGEAGGRGRYRPGYVDQDGKHVFTNPGGFREREDAVRLCNDFEHAIVFKVLGWPVGPAKERLSAPPVTEEPAKAPRSDRVLVACGLAVALGAGVLIGGLLI